MTWDEDNDESQAFLSPRSIRLGEEDSSRGSWWARFNPKQGLYGVYRRLGHRKSRLRCRLTKAVTYFVTALSAFLIAHALLASSYTAPPQHYQELSARCDADSATHRPFASEGCANPNNEKIFIAVSLYDSTGDLAGGLWGQVVLGLIQLLGPSNVFLSIYENDSGPLGAAGLEKLKTQVPCRHRIINDDHVGLDGFATVRMPDNSTRVKRTVYLAEMRNRALQPLNGGVSEEELGVSRFDKILFLNDVLFDPMDAAHLLFNTNRGSGLRAQYLVACALDYYFDPFMMYDTYALRDSEGFRAGEQVFPFFSTAGQGLSRRAVLEQSDAVPVKSCWGGLVAVDARYVQAENTTVAEDSRVGMKDYSIEPDEPYRVKTPVRFRGEREVFLDACECCLFVADVTQAAITAASSELGVYLNPYIRVAYSPTVLRFLRWVQPWERLLTLPQWALSRLKHKPTPNPYRAVAEGEAFSEEVWKQSQDLEGHWELVDRVGRSGLFCAVRNMQIIKPRLHDGDSNWENTLIPGGQSLAFAGS